HPVRLLARGLPVVARTRRAGAGALRPRPRRPQRRRPPVGGVRRRQRAAHRQLPAGLLARLGDRHGAEPLPRHGRTGRAAAATSPPDRSGGAAGRPAVSLEEVKARLARAALLLDFDGTLSPIVGRSGEAGPVAGAGGAV